MSVQVPGNGYIPVGVVRENLAMIDVRLKELKQTVARIREEERYLAAKRAVLTELAENAVLVAPKARTTRAPTEKVDPSSPSRASAHQPDVPNAIPDGRVATPIIVQLIRERPGIKSVEVIDALHSRVTKKHARGPRKFLGDLLWELGHRNKIRREPNGSLYLVEQGGE